MSVERISDEEAEEKILKLEYRLAQIERVEACQDNFLSFVRSMWPEFIAGRHHRIMAEKLERVANGELKRLIINMPPRHTKSEFASFLFPAWMIGKKPAMKIIRRRTPQNWRSTLVERSKTFWNGRIILRYFPTPPCRRTQRPLVGGTRPVEECITAWVLAQTWRDVVVI